MKTLTDNKTQYILGIQHMLAMFGATVLVPIQTGMDPTIALLGAGLGTLVFHYITGGLVPVFLGSSFAFISATYFILHNEGLGAVKGGIIVTGLIYVLMSFIIKLVGVEKVKSFFPPLVNGAIIILIGLRLSPVALYMAGYYIQENGMMSIDTHSFILSSVVVITMILTVTMSKSFLKLIPILISITVGFIVAFIMDYFFGTNFVNTSAIAEASWIGFSQNTIESLLTVPTFSISAMLAIAPISIVVFMEHIGDMTTNGSVVGKNFFEKPGIHRTMLGDGLASIVSGILGGPVTTTYSENTGVLAVTKAYDPKILRIAAIYTVILSFFGKFGAIIQNIPTPIMGGISIILFGMIASMGIRTLSENSIDFTHPRNLVIVSTVLVVGSGISNVQISDTLSVSGLAIAGILGITLNKILPSQES